MNSTFKVVFNKARGALMVVNEATSSVQAKGTKTVIAAAVTAFLAGGTMAGDLVITNDSLPKNDVLQSETTKLVSGKGETLYIQTNGSVGQLMEDASKLKPGDGLTKFLQDISIMLGPHNGSTIITGVTGGYNLMDQESAEFVHSKTSSDLIANKLPKDFSKKLLGQFGFNGSTGGYEMSDRVGDTHIIIGSDSSNPLVLGAIGGDLMMAATETAHAIHRTGTATTDIVSGNSLGVFGGSAVLSTIGTFKPSAGTNLVSVDSTVLNITGKANVGGFAGAGLSVAARESVSQSDVLQNSHVTIDIDKKADPSKLDGIVIGGFGGGVSVATGKGQSSANVNGTTVVDIVNGEVMGVFGGGAAVSFDATVNQFGWAGKLFINTIKGSGSGTATTSSNSIIMNVGAESSTAALAGGSLALADSSENNVGSSTATVKDVVMNFNGPAKLTDDNKAKLHQAAYTYLGKLKTDITTKNFTEFVKDFSGFAGGVNVDGVHAGNLGGGIALARGYFVTDKDNGTVTAASNVDTVTMNFKGGYNVATAAGGLAVAHDKADASKAANQTNANANVDEVNLVISGGENILFTAGGLAYSTAEIRNGGSLVKATANVGSAAVLVSGGSVDGLLGGGIAFDNVNAKASNAVANTENVTITVTGGEINAANVDPITGYIQGENSGVPNRDSHVHQVAKTLGKDGANVAILGGGVASGAGAESSTKDVKLLLNGGKVNDNVFAGGLATLGGKATVEKALVQVNGAEVTGNMYGGGVAGSYQNEAFYADYKTASSNVKETTISLINGSLNGDVYAGGFNIKDSTSSKSTVDTAVIEIGSDFKFLKADAVIDGSGAESATLNFVNGYDFSKAEASEVALLDLHAGIVIKGFDKLDSGDLVTGANYDMGNKTSVEVTGNYEFGEILNATATQTMTVKEGGALAVQSAQALANNFVVEEGVLALGTTARTADARDAFGKYNEKAGLYLSGTVDLASAKINVGNVAADVTTNVNLGSNGTLIVDATAAHEDAPATTVTGTINAVEGSTLHYVNVADQGIVTVDVDGKVKTTVDNLLFKVVEVGDGQNKFTFERATGSDLAGTGLGGFDGDALVGMAENEVIGSLLDQANTAITSGSQREARLNGALNLAAAGGVQTAGIEAATMGIDQATKRAALTNVFQDGWTGFAEVTGTSLKMGGDSGALETKTELGGITVGGEYTMGDMTFGVMGNFGTGDVEGEGDNDGVKNDVDYYGVQGYAAKRMGQFNLVGQMGLMTTKNDVTSADGDSADIDATIFTIGARGEMAFQISKSCQAVPYVGLNYLRVATDGYNTAKGLFVDDMDQNLVSMPIGVAFSGNMDLASGWTLRPTVDVAYVHTFGDTDVEATTKFGAAAINTNLDVWSENVGRVGFGLEARKDALSFGGQIGGAFGDNDHREFYGQLNVKYLF